MSGVIEVVLAAGLAVAAPPGSVRNAHRAKLVSCYDGDTCRFNFHTVDGLRLEQRVRLCDVNAVTANTLGA